MENEIQIDYKRLFKGVNKACKKKLTKSQKKCIEYLIKSQLIMVKLQLALQAGSSYAPAPGKLMKGSALAVEPLSATLEMVTFDDKHIKLQKTLKKPIRSKNGKRRSKKRKAQRK